MKHTILITFLSLITLTNCSISNEDNPTPQVYKTYWHLVNVSGGFAGVNNDFELNKIVWSFIEIENILTVTNNNGTEDEDGLDTGTYTYSVFTDDNGNLFLSINSNEYGHLDISETQLIIDQNITTTGTGADGYIYTFRKILVLENKE